MVVCGFLVGLGWTVIGADDPKEPPKPPEGWVEYAPKDKIFNVWLPKGGTRTERTDTVPVKDQKVRVSSLDLEPGGKGTFVARTFLLFERYGVALVLLPTAPRPLTPSARPAPPTL